MCLSSVQSIGYVFLQGIIKMFKALEIWLAGQGLPDATVQFLMFVCAFALMGLVIAAANWCARKLLVPFIEKSLRKNAIAWDDAFVENHFFRRVSLLLPPVIAYLSADLLFPFKSSMAEFIRRLAMTFFVLASIRVLDALLGAAQSIFSSYEAARDKPIRGYIQAVKIVAYIMAVIFVVAILTNKSPWGILSVLGGLTAVLLLVFKDTILGFVASLQLSANDLVRVGDWIEIPKYGADGDVVDVSIHTVKIRNWDKTIASVPTYALVSDSFKNWRGMAESGGRRIKRALYIDMNSIRFCTGEMLERFKKIELIREYLEAKENEINAYNQQNGVDASMIINGRRQTNIGVLRAYIINYLKRHPQIHQDMTFLVRHLQPTEHGLPVEIYVFSRDQVWANYESIQADIFDHILAAVPLFDLRIFQSPSGYDFHMLSGR